MSRVAQRFRRATLHDEPDRTLLDRFIACRDEAAFAVLVGRHGPLVLGVCRRVLHHHHDAEDAFQATFLVLARKAASLRSRDLLGGWLYGVAYRTALRARAMTNRRRDKERLAARSEVAPEQAADDTSAVLDEELNRLADSYRLPVILCDLQGHTRQSAAAELGIPEGTLSSRLSVARKRLATRLRQRGVSLAAVTVVAVSPALIETTARAAAGGLTAAPAHILLLTEKVLKAMYVTKLCRVLALTVAFFAVVGTTGRLLWRATAQEPARTDPPVAAAPAPRPPLAVKEVFTQAIDAAEAIADPQQKAWMLQEIGEAQAKAGDKEEAIRTLRTAVAAAKQISPEHRRDHTLCWMAGAIAAAGAIKEAKDTAEAIEDAGNRDYGLSNVAVAQAQAGDFEGALETAQTVGSEGLKGQALRQIVDAQAKAGQFKEARALAESITEGMHRSLALACIARAQFRAGNGADARKTLEEAAKIGETLENAVGDTRSVNLGELATARAAMGDVAGARTLAGTIKSDVWRSIALKQIVEVQSDAGDFEAARTTADAIPTGYYNGEALHLLLERQLRAGKKDDARKTAESVTHPFWQLEAQGLLGQVQGRRGDHAETASAFEKLLAQGKDIPDEDKEGQCSGLRNAVRAHLVRAWTKAGQGREALVWAQQQTEPLLRCQAIFSVAEGLVARAAVKK